MWRAARLLVEDTFTWVEAEVIAGAELTPQMRADIRIASTYATEGSRLEWAFRDRYTGTQHAFIGEKTYIDAAQLMLGLIEDAGQPPAPSERETIKKAGHCPAFLCLTGSFRRLHEL